MPEKTFDFVPDDSPGPDDNVFVEGPPLYRPQMSVVARAVAGHSVSQRVPYILEDDGVLPTERDDAAY